MLEIASAKEGDLVLAFDARRFALRSRRILKVVKAGKNQIWQIGVLDGSSIRTTGSHSLRVAGAWKQARHIGEGDLVCCLDASGRLVTQQVVFSAPTTEFEEVFNLVVEGEFCFVADGVVAHCFSYFRAWRVFWWTVFSMLRSWMAPNGIGRENAEAPLAGR